MILQAIDITALICMFQDTALLPVNLQALGQRFQTGAQHNAAKALFVKFIVIPVYQFVLITEMTVKGPSWYACHLYNFTYRDIIQAFSAQQIFYGFWQFFPAVCYLIQRNSYPSCTVFAPLVLIHADIISFPAVHGNIQTNIRRCILSGGNQITERDLLDMLKETLLRTSMKQCGSAYSFSKQEIYSFSCWHSHCVMRYFYI